MRIKSSHVFIIRTTYILLQTTRNTVTACLAISMCISLASAQFFGFGSSSQNALGAGDFGSAFSGGRPAFGGNAVGGRDPRDNRGTSGKNHFQLSFHKHFGRFYHQHCKIEFFSNGKMIF